MNDFPLLNRLQQSIDDQPSGNELGPEPGFARIELYWTDLDILASEYLDASAAHLSCPGANRQVALWCAEEAARFHRLAREAETAEKATASA